MKKIEFGPTNFLYPMPATLVGANVAGKPTYLAIAHAGIMEYSPQHIISISMNISHYTNKGIKENGTFSVNMPSTKMVVVTDYCGIVSGKNVDKSELFETFYGILKTAPMIKECPINMECKLIQTLDIHNHEIFIGEIIESYCDDEYLTEGVPDLAKVDPILFSFYDKNYWKISGKFAKAFNVGKDFRCKKDR